MCPPPAPHGRSTRAGRAAIRPETKLIWLETPANPLLKLADITGISALARERGVLTLVDNTFNNQFARTESPGTLYLVTAA